MAKWGEGDARWIVEEREDSTNVNNWHWTEKNATKWSKERLSTLLVDLSFDDKSGNAKITEMDSCTGDAIANCRKGKLIFFYELVLKLKWKGKTTSGEAVNGTICVPNLSEEQDIEDLEVQVKLTSDETSDRRKVKDLVRKAGAELIRTQIAKWLVDLKEKYAQNLILPTKAGPGKPTPTQPTAGVKVGTAAAAAAVKKPEPEKPKATAFKTIKLSDEFKCRGTELFRALVEEAQVRAYTQSDCKIDAKTGGEFSLFGGNVTGVFKELVPYETIKQAWRFKHWPAGHFSDVTLTITENADNCKLELVHSNIPESDVETTTSGWKSHQWTRMKSILGFGSAINFGL